MDYVNERWMSRCTNITVQSLWYETNPSHLVRELGIWLFRCFQISMPLIMEQMTNDKMKDSVDPRTNKRQA